MYKDNNKDKKQNKESRKYTKLSKEDRVLIAHYLRRKPGYRDIAKILKVHHTTILREVNHNKDEDGVYRALSAHKKALERAKHKQIKTGK